MSLWLWSTPIIPSPQDSFFPPEGAAAIPILISFYWVKARYSCYITQEINSIISLHVAVNLNSRRKKSCDNHFCYIWSVHLSALIPSTFSQPPFLVWASCRKSSSASQNGLLGPDVSCLALLWFVWNTGFYVFLPRDRWQSETFVSTEAAAWNGLRFGRWEVGWSVCVGEKNRHLISIRRISHPTYGYKC